jgi:predicted nucleotidyltransferase
MLSKEEILRLVKRELPFIKKKYNVSRVALFGSYVRGDQNEKSDLDMLVEFSRPVGFFKFIELEDYLSEKLGVKVNLVTPDALKSLIKPHVMEEAVYA